MSNESYRAKKESFNYILPSEMSNIYKNKCFIMYK